MSWEVYRRRFERRAAPASFAKYEAQYEASKEGMLPQFLEESEAACEDYPRALAVARCRLTRHARGVGQFDCHGMEQAEGGDGKSRASAEDQRPAAARPQLLVPLPPGQDSRATAAASWLAQIAPVETTVGFAQALPLAQDEAPLSRFGRIVLVVQDPLSGAEALAPLQLRLMDELRAANVTSAPTRGWRTSDADGRRAALELYVFLFHWLESVVDDIIFVDHLSVPAAMPSVCRALGSQPDGCVLRAVRAERALWQRWAGLPGSRSPTCDWSWPALRSLAPAAAREAHRIARYLEEGCDPEAGADVNVSERDSFCRGWEA